MSKRKQRTQYGVDSVRKSIRGLEDTILTGSVLAIDPSCISSSSNLGYAWYIGGELEESGELSGISSRESLEKRLQYIGKTIRDTFYEPDVLIYERVSISKGRKNLASTLKATGSIIGNFETEYIIPIAPLSWGKYVSTKLELKEGNDYLNYQKYKEEYKSDEMDAIMIGWALLEIARENLGIDSE